MFSLVRNKMIALRSGGPQKHNSTSWINVGSCWFHQEPSDHIEAPCFDVFKGGERIGILQANERWDVCQMYPLQVLWMLDNDGNVLVISLSKCEGSRELCMYGWQQILKDDLSYRPRRRLGPLGDALLWTSVPVCLLGIPIAEELTTLFFWGFLELKTENYNIPPPTPSSCQEPFCYHLFCFWWGVTFIWGHETVSRKHAQARNGAGHESSCFFFLAGGDWGSVWNHLCLLRSPACRWIDKVASLSCKTWVQHMEPFSMDRSLLSESLWQRWWYWHGYATSSIDFISFLCIRSRKAWVRDPWHPRLVKNTLRPQNVDLQSASCKTGPWTNSLNVKHVLSSCWYW